MLIDKTIDTLLLVCQKEPDPFNDVLLKKDGTAYVTDGKMAARASVCSFSDDEFPVSELHVDEDILLDSSLIAEAVKVGPKKGFPIVTQNIAVGVGGDTATLTITDGRRTRSVSDKLSDINYYPSVEEAMNTVFDMKDGLRVNLNVLLLEKLVKMAKKHGTEIVKMTVQSEHVSVEIDTVQVLLLAMIIEEEE